MNISVFGLGYVGSVCAGCLARDGHSVTGVDPNTTKVALINAGRSPVVEAEIDDVIASAVAAGRLRATGSAREAIALSELSLICVGTPSGANGSLDLAHVGRVCEEIGAALAEMDAYHVVVVRSTMLPGSVSSLVIPTLERASGKVAGEHFGVCINAEFMREGSAVYDYYHPPKTVIGETDPRAGDLLVTLYAAIDAPLVRTDLQTAEMVKYVDNAWHALKVGFANEIGKLCKAMSLDSHAVMDIFCRDTKLNLSPYYLRPGFAFGGSCLPKDIRALLHRSRTLDLSVPILEAILPSNRLQIDHGLALILAAGHRRISVLGLSFKAGTDDLRESPLVEVIERLIGKGLDVRIYDENVRLASLVGANRDYILNHIPHITKLMVDTLDEAVAHAETLVIGNASPDFEAALGSLPAGLRVVDFVRLGGIEPDAAADYHGICW